MKISNQVHTNQQAIIFLLDEIIDLKAKINKLELTLNKHMEKREYCIHTGK